MKVTPKSRSAMRLIGAAIQGLLLGALLSVAIVELWATGSDVRLFVYQNF
jgi:hypothetical protein